MDWQSMPERKRLRNDLNEIFNLLNDENDAELKACIAGLLAAGPELTASPYEIATALCSAAPAKPLPSFVFELVVGLYESEAEAGNADAMNDLGALYYDGRGCDQDYAKAVHYYEMAAKHGHRLAQENLGYCYYYGRHVAVDYEKAYHFFALGALSGMPVSLYKLGDMYLNGYYVEQNETEAFRIYEHCMELLDDSSAEYAAGPVFLRLGNAFLHGCGTERNPKAALICYQKAELYFYDMIEAGRSEYRRGLKTALEGQAVARCDLRSML